MPRILANAFCALRSRYLAGIVTAALVGIGVAAVPATVAGAHSDTCGTNCVLVPTPAQDATYGVDNTGATDASKQMMLFLAHVTADRSHVAGTPLTIRLQPASVYWFQYAINFKFNATTAPLSNHWKNSGVPTLDASYVTLDLFGSTVDQCPPGAGTAAARYASCISAWSSVSSAGNAVFTIAGATDVTIDGNSSSGIESEFGKVTNSAFHYACVPPATTCVAGDNNSVWKINVENALDYGNWHGLAVDVPTVVNAGRTVEANVSLIKTDIEWVGGDFVYLRAGTGKHLADPNSAVDIENTTIAFNKLYHSGRQGVTINGGTNVAIAFNDMSDANRHTFDSEPAATAGWQGLNISNNSVSGSGLGFLSFNTLGALANNLTIQNNTFRNQPGATGGGGNFGMTIGHKLPTSGIVDAHGVTITGNGQDQSGTLGPAATSCYLSNTAYLISVGNMDGVTIQNNTHYVKNPTHGAVVNGPGAPTAVITPNNFVNNPSFC